MPSEEGRRSQREEGVEGLTISDEGEEGSTISDEGEETLVTKRTLMHLSEVGEGLIHLEEGEEVLILKWNPQSQRHPLGEGEDQMHLDEEEEILETR